MKTKSISDEVFNHIKSKIISGEWKPGDKITSETQLAINLGVSRLSVREAIGRLVALSILKKKKGGGTFVSSLEIENVFDELLPIFMLGQVDYKQILELRGSIELLAVELFIKNSDKNANDKLTKIFNLMKKSENKNEDFIKYDMDFHKQICEGSGNPLLYKITTLIYTITLESSANEYHKLSHHQRVEEHSKILEAILDSDIELAKLYMKRHLKRTIIDLKKTEQ